MVVLGADEITLIFYPDDDQGQERTPDYRFHCPICNMIEVYPVPEEALTPLVIAGVSVQHIQDSSDLAADRPSKDLGPIRPGEEFDAQIDASEVDEAWFDKARSELFPDGLL